MQTSIATSNQKPIDQSELTNINYTPAYMGSHYSIQLTKNEYANLREFFKKLSKQHKGFFELLKKDCQKIIKFHLDFDFDRYDKVEVKAEPDDVVIDKVLKTIEELKENTKIFGPFVIHGYTCLNELIENHKLPFRYYKNSPKKCSFHVIYYQTKIDRVFLYHLMNKTDLFKYTDRKIYIPTYGEKLFKHHATYKMPFVWNKDNNFKAVYDKNEEILNCSCLKYNPKPKYQPKINFDDDTDLLEQISNQDDDKYIKYGPEVNEFKVYKTICVNCYNSDLIKDNNLLKNTFITLTDDELNDDTFINITPEYIKSKLNIEINVTEKPISKKQKSITKSKNNKNPNIQINDTGDLIADNSLNVLSEEDLWKFLNDFTFTPDEDGNKKYNLQLINYNNALSKYIYTLIKSCPYPYDFIANFLYKWYNQRFHKDPNKIFGTVSINEYQYNPSMDCFFRMLTFMTDFKLKKYWLKKLKSQTFPSINELHKLNPALSYQQFIKNILHEKYTISDGFDENEEPIYKLKINELLNDMRTVISRVETAPPVYYVKQNFDKQEYTYYDKNLKKNIIQEEFVANYKQITATEMHQSLRDIIVYRYKKCYNKRTTTHTVSLYDILHNNLILFTKSAYSFYSENPDIISQYCGLPFVERQINVNLVAEYLNLIFKILCSSNKEVYNWIIDWISYIIQNPSGKTGAKLVISGGQGLGKNLFTEALCKILGYYANPNLTDMNQIIGTFNTAGYNKKLMVCNEIAKSNNKKFYDLDALKAFDTQKTFMMNQKNQAVVQVENVCNLIITSNHYFVSHIDADDRRDLIINPKWRFNSLDEKRKYYCRLWDLLNNKDFITDLYNFFNKHEITTFKTGMPPPITEMKISQKLNSLNLTQKFILSNSKQYLTSIEGKISEKIKKDFYDTPLYKLFTGKYGYPKRALYDNYNKYLKSINPNSKTLTDSEIDTFFAPYTVTKKEKIPNTNMVFISLKPDLKQHYDEMYNLLNTLSAVDDDEEDEIPNDVKYKHINDKYDPEIEELRQQLKQNPKMSADEKTDLQKKIDDLVKQKEADISTFNNKNDELAFEKYKKELSLKDDNIPIDKTLYLINLHDLYTDKDFKIFNIKEDEHELLLMNNKNKKYTHIDYDDGNEFVEDNNSYPDGDD